ncbi:MAG: helix-turn-helix domain-containing protein [Trebonia sp.]|jgi:AcrR family transcriptional regulator
MDAARSDAAGAGGNGPATTRRGDTRARIQHVALELFAEQGYERTSLREVAERLGVTKAALYYHFKSKEDIVASFTEDYFDRVDTLIAWGKAQPPTPQAGHELFERYIAIVIESSEVFRFLERNQASLHGSGESHGSKHRFAQFRPRMNALVEIIAGPGAPPRSRIRATSALFSVSAACMFFLEDPAEATAQPTAKAGLPRLAERDELHKIVLEIADDLTGDLGDK